MRNFGRVSGLFLAAIIGVACGSTGDPAEGGGTDTGEAEAVITKKVWPESFSREAFLLADQIVIQGPYGLLDHVALGRDPENLDYSAKTVPEGFRQVLKRKDAGSYVEIRANLDNWTIVALDSILVLESAADVDVRIIAVGNAVWRNTDERGPLTGSAERRAAKLEFTGGQ